MATTKKQTPDQENKSTGGMSAGQTGNSNSNPGSGSLSSMDIGGLGSSNSAFGANRGEGEAGSASGTKGPDQITTRSDVGSSSSSGGTAAGTAVARSLYDQAKETAGQAYEVAAEKATTKLEEQKTNLSGGLSTVADSVRKVSENLRGPDVQDGISKFTAEYSDVAAEKIENVANYFEQKSVREMYSDVENFARRNPTVFVGGAFALGLLLSRFLKSGTAAPGSGPDSASKKSHSMPSGGISTASDHSSGQGVQGIAGGSIDGGLSRA